MELSYAVGCCLLTYLTLFTKTIWALPQSASTSASSPVAVPTACGEIITFANEDLSQNWLFEAEKVYECLTSVPFLDAVALRYVDYYNTTMQFQSTLAYLKTPPTGYQQPAVDFQQVLGQIKDNITAGRYANEYDFEATLWSLSQRMHDSHVTLNYGALSAFTFGSPYDIMSVSIDGKQAPKVYIKEDVIYSASQGYTPSAIRTINGEDAAQYLERFASINSVGMLESHADWNQLMYSPVQDILGTYNLFGWNAVLYPGDNLTFAFENGTTLDSIWLAFYLNEEQTGPLTTGGDFYNYFVLGFLPASFVSTSQNYTDTNVTTNDNGTAPAILTSWYNVTSAYPVKADIVQPDLAIGGSDGVLTGYFLTDISTAVLSMPNFDEYADSAESFSNTTRLFIQRAKAAGMTKVVIDLQQNYGGDVILAFDTFRQFFPNIDPYGGSRRRSQRLGNIMGDTITSFWNALSPQNTEYSYDDFYAPMASSEFVITDRLNAATGQNFTSWSQYAGPRNIQGDQFSLVERYNLSSPVFVADASEGFVPEDISAQAPPWTSENVILLTDGLCGSTCSIFVEMMTHDANVRSVVVGGKPVTGPMQAASGGRGARVFDADDLDANMLFAGLVNDTANVTLPQVRDQAIFTYSMTFNLRDQVRKGDDVPLQFKYSAANCRIYFTFQNAYNMSRLWRDAAAAIWTDPSLCVAGSTGYATTGNSTAALTPPAAGSVAPAFKDVQSGQKVQYALDFGPGLVDASKARTSDTFSACNNNCAAALCLYYTCPDNTRIALCAPDCQTSIGTSCANGKGTCQSSTSKKLDSKLNVAGGGPAQQGKFSGVCQPIPGKLSCSNSKLTAPP